MINKFQTIGILAGLSISAVAQAGDAIDIQGRLGGAFGLYDNEFTFFDPVAVSDGSAGSTFKVDRDENLYGLLSGVTASMNGFYASADLEYLLIEDDEGMGFDSTDISLTLGKQFANGWGPFVGLRHVRQGDGFWKDEIQRENGLYAGVSYGGLQLGQHLSLGLGVAYVRSNINSDGTKFDDADGISARTTLSFVGTPHSLSLRYRAFNGEVDNVNLNLDIGRGSVETVNFSKVEIEESFLTLTYQYTLPITSFPISSGF